MQYLNPIYIISFLFEQKIQIQLKDFLFCKKRNSLRIINFLNCFVDTAPLFQEPKIQTAPLFQEPKIHFFFFDKISSESCPSWINVSHSSTQNL